MYDGYRRFRVDFAPFRADIDSRQIVVETETAIAKASRDGIVSAADAYFRGRNMSVNPEALKKLTDADLVTALSMGCPFTPEEKVRWDKIKDRKIAGREAIETYEQEIRSSKDKGYIKFLEDEIAFEKHILSILSKAVPD